MTTSPQDDLTAERAAAIRLYENIFAMSPDTEAMEAGDDCQYEAIARALRTARQEALREAAKVARNRADLLKPKLGLWLNMVNYHRSMEADELADELDRLASEGA